MIPTRIWLQIKLVSDDGCFRTLQCLYLYKDASLPIVCIGMNISDSVNDLDWDLEIEKIHYDINCNKVFVNCSTSIYDWEPGDSFDSVVEFYKNCGFSTLELDEGKKVVINND